jgi:RNA polymerase sigma factor (sigma-70 family)
LTQFAANCDLKRGEEQLFLALAADERGYGAGAVALGSDAEKAREGTTMRGSPIRRGGAGGDELVLALVREHAGELLRFARRFSICADDAQDAYQRALEKLVMRMRGTPPSNVLSWLRTVLRHEAMAVRAERERMLGRALLDDDRDGDAAAIDPAERVERFERLAHTAEALRGLKPQELTALALRAEGLSYREICERTSWTYTRCNRAITEGRRALLARLQAIESGAECDRWLPVLSRFADGEAGAAELAELRPHLRSCAGCRATLRGFHAAPAQVGALVPVELLPVVVAAGAGAGGGLGVGRHLDGLLHMVLDRAGTSVLRVQGAIDALPGTKLAAVAASTVAVAGSGAAIEQAATAGVERAPPPRVAAVAATTPAPSTPTAPISAAAVPPAAPSAGPGTGSGAGEPPDGAGDPGAVFAANGALPGEFALERSLSAVAALAPAEYAAAAGAAAATASGPAAFSAAEGAGAPARRSAAFDAVPSSGAGSTSASRERGSSGRDRPSSRTAADGGASREAPDRGGDAGADTAKPGAQPGGEAAQPAARDEAPPASGAATAAPSAPPVFDQQPSQPTKPQTPAATGGEFGGF